MGNDMRCDFHNICCKNWGLPYGCDWESCNINKSFRKIVDFSKLKCNDATVIEVCFLADGEEFQTTSSLSCHLKEKSIDRKIEELVDGYEQSRKIFAFIIENKEKLTELLSAK